MKKIIMYLFVICVCLLFYSFVEPYWLKINHIYFANNDLPEKFDNTKIIFVADIHHGPFLNINRVKKLVMKINALNPDIVILGGDYVHMGKNYIEPCFNELKNIKSKYGIFAVLGNHDHWEDADMTKKNIKKSGMTLLDNRSVWIIKNNERIKILGVGDLWTDKQDIESNLIDVNKQDFTILVSHNPDYVEALNTDKIDLMLSGHTHGGQATFFGLWTPLIPSRFGEKYRKGFIKTKDTTLFVTTGFGTVAPPVRFLVRPEIVVMNLKKEE